MSSKKENSLQLSQADTDIIEKRKLEYKFGRIKTFSVSEVQRANS